VFIPPEVEDLLFSEGQSQSPEISGIPDDKPGCDALDRALMQVMEFGSGLGVVVPAPDEVPPRACGKM
tara:strand:+ start:489 stop:692 length:204 start_codon:yes stop_codon:yes gene_type:complete